MGYYKKLKEKEPFIDLSILICLVVNLFVGLLVTVGGNVLINQNDQFKILSRSDALTNDVYRRYVCIYVMIYLMQMIITIVINVFQFIRNRSLYDEKKRVSRRNINMIVSSIPFVLQVIALLILRSILRF